MPSCLGDPLDNFIEHFYSDFTTLGGGDFNLDFFNRNAKINSFFIANKKN